MTAALSPAAAVAAVDWSQALPLLLLGAWLAADETSFAQTWFSQPLPAAVLAGLAVGDVTLGLAVGLPFQLATLGNLPVGQSFLGDKTTPVIGAVWALDVAGFFHGEPPALWGAGGDAARVGWVLVFLAAAACVGHVIRRSERRLHLRWSAVGLRCLRDGRVSRLDSLQLRCLATTMLRGLVLTALWAWAAAGLWIPAFEHLPGRVVRALSYLPAFTPVLAVGALSDLYGSRQGMRWLGGSFGLALLLIAFGLWRGWGP